jgi:acyl-CoA reductase-like NAD-dependent aldehyde dehydrogenase
VHRRRKAPVVIGRYVRVRTVALLVRQHTAQLPHAIQGRLDQGNQMSYQTTNPYSEQIEQTFTPHSDAQMDGILAQAATTFESDWRQRSFAERKAVVKKAAMLLKEQRDSFAKLITVEMGKLFQEAQQEVSLCV